MSKSGKEWKGHNWNIENGMEKIVSKSGKQTKAESDWTENIFDLTYYM